MSPIAVGNQTYFCCFTGVIVDLTTVYNLNSFFTLIFAVLIIKKLLFELFSQFFIYS